MSLDNIRARAQAATPGPWTDFPGYGTDGDAIMSVFNGDNWVAACDPEEQGQADAEFIAQARTDIPLLLNAIDAYAETLNEHGRHSFYADIDAALS